VVSHDPYLNPAITRNAAGQWLDAGADGKGRGPLIKDLTLTQLQAYDVGRINPASAYAKQFPQQQPGDGQRVPTLAALFKLVGELGATEVRFNIETKINPARPEDTASPETFVSSFLKTVTDAGMQGRVTLQSFDWRTLQLLQRLAPAIPTVYLTVQAPSFDNIKDTAWTAGLRLADHGNSLPRLVKAAGGKVWSPNAGSLSAAQVKEAQALGLQVIPWTVNAPADMARLLDWQVDGLITDYPNLLRDLMRERGMTLPPVLKK
jgi:glycerophosphoryl diester phosphodiesterase